MQLITNYCSVLFVNVVYLDYVLLCYIFGITEYFSSFHSVLDTGGFATSVHLQGQNVSQECYLHVGPYKVRHFQRLFFHKSFYYFCRLTCCVMFAGFPISTVSVALGALTLWHALLITRGETSIERHINSKEAKRLAKRGRVRMHWEPFRVAVLTI